MYVHSLSSLVLNCMTAYPFISRFGNVLSPVILSVAEFRQRYRADDGLVQEIVDTGHVVHGKLISEVLHEPQEDPQ